MRVLKDIVALCLIAIILLIFLSYVQIPKTEQYALELSDISPINTKWALLNVVASSFYYMVNSPTITSDLFIFMCFVGIFLISYAGFILGLLIAIVERKKKSDFVFMLSFTACLFFAVFVTVIAIMR